MAQVRAFQNNFHGLSIPPGGTFYFNLQHASFGAGSINVTAHCKRGVSGTINDYCEVVQMATRLENPSTGPRYFLDVVIRNNDPHGSWQSEYWVYTSVITP